MGTLLAPLVPFLGHMGVLSSKTNSFHPVLLSEFQSCSIWYIIVRPCRRVLVVGIVNKRKLIVCVFRRICLGLGSTKFRLLRDSRALPENRMSIGAQRHDKYA
jgi:hypothetical protein